MRDPVQEVRRGDVEFPHTGMQALERECVVGGREVSRRNRLVVRPQRDLEAVALVDAWLHARLERCNRTVDLSEPLSKLDFELCALMRRVMTVAEADVTTRRDPGHD